MPVVVVVGAVSPVAVAVDVLHAGGSVTGAFAGGASMSRWQWGWRKA